MSEPSNKQSWQQSMPEIVGEKQQRRLDARRQSARTVWFGLGMFGLVGWSVSVPTLIGVATGLWIDHRWPSQYSWTLMLMVAGLGVGCWNAWWWIYGESKIEESVDESHQETEREDKS